MGDARDVAGEQVTPDQIDRVIGAAALARANNTPMDLLLLDLNSDDDARPIAPADAEEIRRRLQLAPPDDVVRIGGTLKTKGAACIVFGPDDSIDAIEISDATLN